MAHLGPHVAPPVGITVPFWMYKDYNFLRNKIAVLFSNKPVGSGILERRAQEGRENVQTIEGTKCCYERKQRKKEL